MNEFTFFHTLASLLSCLAGVIILSRFRCRRRSGPVLKLSTISYIFPRFAAAAIYLLSDWFIALTTSHPIGQKLRGL